MFHPRRPTALALLLLAAACGDRDASQPPTAPELPLVPAAVVSPETQALEGVARRLALALNDAGFRHRLRARLAASPFRENKLPLQRMLAQNNGVDRREVARLVGEPDQVTDSVLNAAIPLEVYLPVPGHRRDWQGEANLLVATAARDGEIPVAFDPAGGRHLLDPAQPPSTPVIAVVPVETDFDRVPTPRASITCIDCDTEGSGGGTAGMYMTRAHFNSDFEGWLKGNPEFEIHIMGQKGASDSLMKYECAGEHEGGLNYWDGGTDWKGSVLLFSRAQIDAYQAAHPGEAFRIVAMEDDDTSCELRVDPDRWSDFLGSLGPLYKDMTGAADSGSVNRILKAAKSLKKFFKALANLIKTNDELIGNAIEASLTGEYRAGFNWVLKSDNNQTNGWLNLVVD